MHLPACFAWVPELPGCYGSGASAEEAVAVAPAAVRAWRGRLGLPVGVVMAG